MEWGRIRSLTITNWIRQSGYFSYFVILVFDVLLSEMQAQGLDCYWDNHFAVALAYANDLVLLALCVSALRLMLRICEPFASASNLCYNPLKTRLIRFCLMKGGLDLKPKKKLNTYLSCHNFFFLSSVQTLLIPPCCLLCVL